MGWLEQTICGLRGWTVLKLGLVGVALIVLIACVASINHGTQQAKEPGLRYEPNLGHDVAMHFNYSRDTQIVKRLKNLMEDYRFIELWSQTVWDCRPEHYPKASTGDVCVFRDDMINWRCGKIENFGYPYKPCIFILLNKVENWVPVTYKALDELPQLMPADLRNHIAEVTKNNTGKVPEVVWIHCEGQKPIDEEYLGSIKYYSPWNGWRGIPAYYFPYKDTTRYMAPMFPIQLDRLTDDVLLYLECTAWAKNLNHKTSVGHNLITIPILRSRAK